MCGCRSKPRLITGLHVSVITPSSTQGLCAPYACRVCKCVILSDVPLRPPPPFQKWLITVLLSHLSRNMVHYESHTRSLLTTVFCTVRGVCTTCQYVHFTCLGSPFAESFSRYPVSPITAHDFARDSASCLCVRMAERPANKSGSTRAKINI